MTLLSPAVLHCSALEHIKDESPAFHKTYIFKFGLMQGLWAVILYLLCVAVIVVPKVQSAREMGAKILTNANFSTITINHGVMEADIKPAIWTFTMWDSTTSKTDFAVDNTGKMNRFYWDDRTEKGERKQVNGIAFMKNYLFIKKGTEIKKIPYTKFFGNRNVEFTKKQLYDKLLHYTDRAWVLKVFLLLVPLVFIFGSAVGMLMHVIYIFVVGAILWLLTQKFTRTTAGAYKIASGLYVGWAYVMVLLVIVEKIVYNTLADLSSFYIAIKAIVFATLIFVGYLCIQSSQTIIQAQTGTKIKRKGS